MPAIPQYQQRVEATGPLPQIAGRISPLSVAGEVAERVSSNVDRIAEYDDATDVASALSKLRMQTTQRLSAAQETAAPDAADFTPQRMREFAEDLGTIAGETRSPRAAALVKQHAQEVREQLFGRSMEFEASRRRAFRVESMHDSADRSRVALELEPDQFDSVRAEQLQVLNSLGIEPTARAELARHIDSTLTEAAATGLAKRNPRLALENLATADSGDPRFDRLAPDARHRVEQRARLELVEQSSRGILSAYGISPDAGVKALSALRESEIPSELIDDIRGEVRQGLSLLHAERREQYADAVNGLERSISAGAPASNAEELAGTLYRRAAYTPDQYTNVLQAIDTARQKGASAAAEIASIEQAFNEGIALDPRNEKVTKAADTWFRAKTATGGIQPGSNDWISSAAIVASRTNILPSSAMEWARSTLLTGTPDKVVPAANAIRRWSDAAPAAYAFFEDPKLKAYADHVDALVRAGTAPARAVEMAGKDAFEISAPRREALSTEYKKLADDNSSHLKSAMDSDDNFDRSSVPFVGAPLPPDAMANEYDVLVRTYFDHTNGDIKRARDLAWKDIRGTYGYSTVNGVPEILKYAPELIYPGIDVSVIRTDIAAAVGPQTWDGFPALKNDDGTFSTRLTATVKDAALNGGKPTNIPTIWKGEKLTEAAAIAAAVESGEQFPSFKSVKDAVTAAKTLSDAIGAAEIDPDRVQLVPSRETGDTHGLVWGLQTIDEDGHHEVLLDANNRPLRYVIPTDTASYLKAQEDAKRKAVEKARAESARRREAAAVFPDESFPGF